jgi:branched-chain amino acid transport system permease protein
MPLLAIQALTGLASASALFLVAAGLTVIFGVTRIVNFAHGSLFMLGAYVGWSLITRLPPTPLGFALGALGAAAALGLAGVAMEAAILRRLYRAPPILQLLATFAVALIVQDAALFIWGPDDLALPRPPWLRGFVRVAGSWFPAYDLALIAVGPLVLLALWLAFTRTRWGTLVRAAAEDREMVGALGVDQCRLFTAVFALGAALVGLGGALSLGDQSANLGMDLGTVTDAFVIVVLGGLGSLPGAYLASVLIGEVQAFGLMLLPQASLALAFAAMAVVLTVRPNGLLGRPLPEPRAGAATAPLIRPAPLAARWLGALALAAAVAAPAFVGAYGLSVLTEAAVAVLFAASLHLIMGPGGMASFGQAAFFGIGAYAAGLLAARQAPMLLALAAARSPPGRRPRCSAACWCASRGCTSPC